MKAIQYEDIYPIEEYNKKRNELREKIFFIKKPRRFHVGPYFTFLFENYHTVWYQIQEMIRAEGITSKEAINFEIQTYSELLPQKQQIKVSLLIEIDDSEFRKHKLKELLGLEKTIFFFYDNKEKTIEIPAEFDKRQFNKDRISSVQYLTFSFNEEQTQEFLKTNRAGIKVTHPAYNYLEYFNQEQLLAIQEDLKDTLN